MYEDEDDKWKSKTQHKMIIDDEGCIVSGEQIIEILAIMEYLSLTKSNWSIRDRIIVCGIYQHISRMFVLQLQSEYLSKKKIHSTVNAGKLLFLIDGANIDSANLCKRSSSEVTTEERMQAAITLKWSSYAHLLSKYHNVSVNPT